LSVFAVNKIDYLNVAFSNLFHLNFIPPFFYFELGGHLGWKSGSPDTILEGGHLKIISAKFGISIMMSFLTRITGFFMNFELLPILTDYAN
jgi:hypothetical protein